LHLLLGFCLSAPDTVQAARNANHGWLFGRTNGKNRSEKTAMTEPNCPACQEQRIHTAEEWKNHLEAGHGFTPETGWRLPPEVFSLLEDRPGSETQ
jgi:hypothetical protein